MDLSEAFRKIYDSLAEQIGVLANIIKDYDKTIKLLQKKVRLSEAQISSLIASLKKQDERITKLEQKEKQF